MSEVNPYATPESDVAISNQSGQPEPEYVGFWLRVVAAVVDSILMALITLPLLWLIYGESYFLSEELVQGPLDILISYVLPIVAVVAFWVYRGATPGKMAVTAKIVDAKTLEPASTLQLIGRYLAYYPSALLLGFGILMVAFDKRKQGLHDKLAGTVVIKG